MQQVLFFIHIVIALLVITLVLVQHGKGADAGSAFGSGASGTVFGAGGALGVLVRITFIVAALFFVTSLGLFYLAADRVDGSVLDSTSDSVLEDIQNSLPATPDTTPPTPTQ